VERRACRRRPGSGSGLRRAGRRSANPGGGPAPGAERPAAAAEARPPPVRAAAGEDLAARRSRSPPATPPMRSSRGSSLPLQARGPRSESAPTVRRAPPGPDLERPKREAHGVSSLERKLRGRLHTGRRNRRPVEARRGAPRRHATGRPAAFLREGQPDRPCEPGDELVLRMGMKSRSLAPARKHSSRCAACSRAAPHHLPPRSRSLGEAPAARRTAALPASRRNGQRFGRSRGGLGHACFGERTAVTSNLPPSRSPPASAGIILGSARISRRGAATVLLSSEKPTLEIQA